MSSIVNESRTCACGMKWERVILRKRDGQENISGARDCPRCKNERPTISCSVVGVPAGSLMVWNEKPSWVPFPILSRDSITKRDPVLEESDQHVFSEIHAIIHPGSLRTWDDRQE